MTTDEADALLEQMPFSFIIKHADYRNGKPAATYVIADVLRYCLGIQDIEEKHGKITRKYFLAVEHADSMLEDISGVPVEDIKCVVTLYCEYFLIGDIEFISRQSSYRKYHFRNESDMVIAKLCA